MKKTLGGINALYPTPTVIVGAIVAGKPNFITIAHIGIVNHAKPHLISISMGKAHYTNAGIRENKEFSVNVPSEKLVVETDYVGIVSGKKVDKSGVFDLFYGSLPKAPMIKACPLCMECRLSTPTTRRPMTFSSARSWRPTPKNPFWLDGKVDVSKVRPLFFDMNSVKYWSLGPAVAGCWSVGKQMKK